MSDLISRSNLLKELESSVLQPTKDTDGFIDGWCEGFNTVVDMIRNQTTAFDTEKVIAELENEKERYEKDRVWWSEHSWKDSCVYNECDMNDRKSDCFEKAIDIVKKGGVE